MRREITLQITVQYNVNRWKLVTARPRIEATEGTERPFPTKDHRTGAGPKGSRKLHLERRGPSLLSQLIPEAVVDQARLFGNRGQNGHSDWQSL